MGSGPSKETGDKEPATVVIAGGGIVGLVLAMSLKKHLNIRSEVYEKTHTFATEAGAGLGMYPNGLRVLRDISPELLHAVRDAGYPYKSRRWERHDGTGIMNADESLLAEDQKDLEPIGIRRSKLQKVLYHYARFQGIKVHFQTPLANAVERDDGLVEVTFGDGTKRLTKVLFGADGALGKSRSLVAGADEPALKYTGVTCLMGLSRCRCDGIYFPSSETDDFHAVFFPTGENETCFQFHVPVSEDQADSLNWGNLSQQVGQEECRKIAETLRAEGWHQKYIDPLENLIQAVRIGFALLEPPLDKWVKGHIALVGDAAHPPVPYIGQGAQQGLEDAGVVASLLKIYCLNEEGKFDMTNFEKAMTLYQDIRIKRSSQILEFSKTLGKMQSDRARAKDDDAMMADNILKGEVLMYGTLPIMLPGAGHDYKEDVKVATEELDLPHVSEEAAIEALDLLLGFVPPRPPNPRTAAVSKKQLTFHLPEEYSLPEQRIQDLVDWIVEGLKVHLKRIVAHNANLAKRAALDERSVQQSWSSKGQPIIHEVAEIINFPDRKRDELVAEQDPNWVMLSPKVTAQLADYISVVAKLYHDNPFHNFEHACNVTVAVSKFLNRMTTEKDAMLTLNDRCYGIVQDPLTQFTIVLAAMLHDADHGLGSTQQQSDGGETQMGRHSIDVAFGILMEPKYRELRLTIYKDEEEMRRFRQLLVNAVAATDICDKQLKEFRDRRWEKVFAEEKNCNAAILDPKEEANRKATVAVEALIQASDVLHCMQPWEIFRQWNERLFAEMYKAYKEGRSEVDPSSFWFKGELAFFDLYVIPLAMKLEACQVFGSMSKECLGFAKANRQAWRLKGPSAVNAMIRKVALEQAIGQ